MSLRMYQVSIFKLSPRHRGIAAALLVASVALNGYTLHSAFDTESVTEKPVITLVADATERVNRQREVAGVYATGNRPGDRVISVKSDGRVHFSEVGMKPGVSESEDRYQLGKQGPKFCLTTSASGVIDILNFETLVYYRDTYKRRQDALVSPAATNR